MSFNTIDLNVKDYILTLTLNRPESLNAFTVEMANELIEAFNQASEDDAIRAIVVTGAGRAFCAGMDLSVEGNVFGLDEAYQPTLEDMEHKLEDPAIVNGVRDTGGRVVLAIYDCKKPVIAAINGAAVGIGATMTCAMDIRLASEYARIGFVFNKIGITYTGEILKPDAVLAAGYVKGVYPAGDLLEEAYKIARKIASHSPVAITLTRQMMYRNAAQDHPMAAHKVDSLAIYYASLGDGKEGVRSFLEKRAPNFEKKSSTDMPDFYPWWEK